jgi:NAD(P)-dependent dehydrogenase (short-subunit alcohol dehydrogenase family)
MDIEVFMEIILVTGANRGIGLALTKVLLANRNTVIAACRRPQEASELMQLTLLHPETIDVAKFAVDREEEVVEAAAALRKRHQKLDVIVNNAGIMPEHGHESILRIDLELLRQAFDTNALGAARVIRAFYPMLAKSERPRIINVSSGLSSVSTKDNNRYYAYSISKVALNMLTRMMAHEFAPSGVTTVAVSPGWVKTDMGGKEAHLSPEESAQSLAEAIKRIGPELNGQFLDRDGRIGRYPW